MQTGDYCQKPAKFVSAGTFARAAGVDRRTVERWCNDRKIESFRTQGGHYRIPSAELKRYLTQE